MGDANLDSNNLGLLLEFATQPPWLDTLKIDNNKYFNNLLIASNLCILTTILCTLRCKVRTDIWCLLYLHILFSNYITKHDAYLLQLLINKKRTVIACKGLGSSTKSRMPKLY